MKPPRTRTRLLHFVCCIFVFNEDINRRARAHDRAVNQQGFLIFYVLEMKGDFSVISGFSKGRISVHFCIHCNFVYNIILFFQLFLHFTFACDTMREM